MMTVKKKNQWFPEGGKKEGIDRAQRIFRVVKGDLYDITVADTCPHCSQKIKISNCTHRPCRWPPSDTSLSLRDTHWGSLYSS